MNKRPWWVLSQMFFVFMLSPTSTQQPKLNPSLMIFKIRAWRGLRMAFAFCVVVKLRHPLNSRPESKFKKKEEERNQDHRLLVQRDE